MSDQINKEATIAQIKALKQAYDEYQKSMQEINTELEKLEKEIEASNNN